MEKVPFNALGVQRLLQQLYALDRAALQVEIDALQASLQQWVLAHFTLNDRQQRDLANMDDTFAQLLSAELAESFALQQPVNLVKTGKEEEDPGEGVGKLYGLSRSTQHLYSETLGVRQNSTLILSISYQ
ncbi:hypothetical protein GCM10023231_01230 [Olivibacter ginsenosidimutans]|uniref:Uncharacterized protein n=1 Tax=Olivibacter ginsenosidimutans TaxID=1176537 RepID=A0ABP9ADV0_9SPHI